MRYSDQLMIEVPAGEAFVSVTRATARSRDHPCECMPVSTTRRTARNSSETSGRIAAGS